MRRLNKKSLYQCLAFLVPLLTFFSPSWISLVGVGPRWAELWLLPWALEEGPFSGAFSGFLLGLILDSMNLGTTTNIPALIFLGYWWGRLGKADKFGDKFFVLGFLAWLGAFASGLSIWVQEIFLVNGSYMPLFNIWAFQTVLAGSIMTGIIAPILCSNIIRFFFTGKS